MQIEFNGISQRTFGAAGADVTVFVTYTVLGPGTDFVECYATSAAGSGFGVLEDQFETSVTESLYTQNITLKAGNYYTIALCPRSGPKDNPDQEVDGYIWTSYCVFATLITHAQPPPPPPPVPSPTLPTDPGPPLMAETVPFKRISLKWDHTWPDPIVIRLSIANALAEDWVPPPAGSPRGSLIDSGPFIFNSTYRYWRISAEIQMFIEAFQMT